MKIKILLRQTGLFDNISSELLEEIISYLERVSFAQNEIIIHEGELGDAFYIIVSGAVRVFTYDDHGEEIALARLGEGNFFGEQALLAETAELRNASVKAIEIVQLLKISKAHLQKILHQDNALTKKLFRMGEQQLIENFSKQSEAWYVLQGQFVASSEIKTFASQDIIFKAGDSPDYVYFILSGEISITSPSQQVIKLTKGHIFGEFAIIENKTRFGTAKAEKAAKLIAVSAEKFMNLYESNAALKDLVIALTHIYQIPHRGVAEQFNGKFLNQSSVNTLYKLTDGRSVLASRLLAAPLFAVRETASTDSRKLIYRPSADRWREICLREGRLAGFVNLGEWEDLGTMSAMVLDGALIDEKKEQSFLKTGMFAELPLGVAATEVCERIVCECMSIDHATISRLINQGAATTLEQVNAITGAGSVCGSCQPKIAEMLGRTTWFPAKLTEQCRHTPRVRSYLIEPISGEFMLPKPGQYIILQVQINQNWVERAYTLTSLGDAKHLTITVKLERHGLFSRWLFQRTQVDMLRVSSPLGEFILNPDSISPLICFAAGIGITPFICFARALAAGGSQRPLYIDYSAKNKEDLIYAEELKQLAARCPTIKFNARITSDVGRLTREEVEKILRSFSYPQVYICGPSGFQAEIVDAAKQAGVPANHIKVEQFFHAGGPLPKP